MSMGYEKYPIVAKGLQTIKRKGLKELRSWKTWEPAGVELNKMNQWGSTKISAKTLVCLSLESPPRKLLVIAFM